MIAVPAGVLGAVRGSPELPEEPAFDWEWLEVEARDDLAGVHQGRCVALEMATP